MYDPNTGTQITRKSRSGVKRVKKKNKIDPVKAAKLINIPETVYKRYCLVFLYTMANEPITDSTHFMLNVVGLQTGYAFDNSYIHPIETVKHIQELRIHNTVFRYHSRYSYKTIKQLGMFIVKNSIEYTKREIVDKEEGVRSIIFVILNDERNWCEEVMDDFFDSIDTVR